MIDSQIDPTGAQRYLLLEINTITKLLPLRIKHIIDGGYCIYPNMQMKLSIYLFARSYFFLSIKLLFFNVF